MTSQQAPCFFSPQELGTIQHGIDLTTILISHLQKPFSTIDDIDPVSNSSSFSVFFFFLYFLVIDLIGIYFYFFSMTSDISFPPHHTMPLQRLQKGWRTVSLADNCTLTFPLVAHRNSLNIGWVCSSELVWKS